MRPDPYFRFGAELVQSRRLLLDVLEALEQQKEALTVVGAHAVFERVKDVAELAMDSTRDADLAVFPHLVAAMPQIDGVLAALGLTLASSSRPGVWGRRGEPGHREHSALTIDLLAPASLAGSGRRAARLNGEHGRNSVSKTAGLEQSLIDRSIMTLTAFDASGSAAQAYVAGTAALVCAKAYKLHDRLDAKELSRNAARL